MVPKILTRSTESVFEALVPARDGDEGYKRTTFPASTVAQIDEGAGKTTLLRLFTGAVIPVALPYEMLQDYLYGDNMKTRQPFYDLTAVTGPALAPLYSPGKMIAGKGVFVGEYTPKDRNGISLSKTFNIFAAPEDLPGTMTYVKAVKHVAGLKNWHGHDGTDYATDEKLYAALKDGSYKGGWFIPTREILHGQDVDGREIMPDNIFAHRHKGAFKGTFKTVGGSDFAHWYWSCSERRVDASYVYDVGFTDGVGVVNLKDGGRLSSRVVRAELRP